MSARLTALAILINLLSALAAAQNAPAAGTVRYQSVRVEGVATVRELQKTHGAEGFLAILHINRIDLEHLRDGATLIVPESPSSLDTFSPFPQALGSAAPSVPKLLLVSRRVQAFAAYESGMRVRMGRCQYRTPRHANARRIVRHQLAIEAAAEL